MRPARQAPTSSQAKDSDGQCTSMTGHVADGRVLWTHRCVRQKHIGGRGKCQLELVDPQPVAPPSRYGEAKRLERVVLDLIVALEAAEKELVWCGSTRHAKTARKAAEKARVDLA